MSELTALGVDIFAGGFTVGMSKHFEVLGHLEEGSYGVKSTKLNFPHMPIIVGQTNWKPFIDDLRVRRGRPNLVYCNPPCAMFSVAGATMRGGGNAWRSDPRQSCWHACFSVFEELLPDVFVIESVTRAFTAGREFVEQFAERAKALGYSTTHLLLDAKNHGLPQTRKRYFLVIHKDEFNLQAPNWGQPYKTAAEALTEVLDPGYVGELKDPVQLEMLPKLKHGQAMRPLWEKKMRETVGPEESWPRSPNGVKGRPRLFLHRINPDKPIGTITGDYFVHPYEDRMIGMNELKHFNGFPVDYQFESHPRYWPSLIARGVSPTVADYLGKNIAQAIRNKRPVATPTIKVFDIQNAPKSAVAA